VARASYLRGVATSEDVARLRDIAEQRGVLLGAVQAELVQRQLDRLAAVSRTDETVRFYLPTPGLELVDVRPGDSLAEAARRSAERFNVSLRAWVFTAVSRYCEDSRQA
jgi:hypothetical protein